MLAVSNYVYTRVLVRPFVLAALDTFLLDKIAHQSIIAPVGTADVSKFVLVTVPDYLTANAMQGLRHMDLRVLQ